ncbi:MAG: hypothetical protein ACK55Z_32425, partial [bacterium]
MAAVLAGRAVRCSVLHLDRRDRHSSTSETPGSGPERSGSRRKAQSRDTGRGPGASPESSAAFRGPGDRPARADGDDVAVAGDHPDQPVLWRRHRAVAGPVAGDPDLRLRHAGTCHIRVLCG